MAFPSKKKSAGPSPAPPQGDDNYNNSAMDLMNPDDDAASSPSPDIAGASDQGSNGGVQISKVPGGFQVSTVVPTLQAAHAISQQFLGSDEGAEQDQDQAPPVGTGDSESEADGDDGGPVEA